MAKVLMLVLGLSLITERVTDKILYVTAIKNKKVFSWFVSTILGLLISYSFSFGIIRELGLSADSPTAAWVDYLLTGLLIASGSEPIHSIIDALAFKRDELKKKAKNV